MALVYDYIVTQTRRVKVVAKDADDALVKSQESFQDIPGTMRAEVIDIHVSKEGSL